METHVIMWYVVTNTWHMIKYISDDIMYSLYLVFFVVWWLKYDPACTQIPKKGSQQIFHCNLPEPWFLNKSWKQVQYQQLQFKVARPFFTWFDSIKVRTSWTFVIFYMWQLLALKFFANDLLWGLVCFGAVFRGIHPPNAILWILFA